MVVKGQRIDCRCGAAHTPCAMNMPIAGVMREVGFACVCKASQDPAAEACWNCLKGAHRRLKV